VLPEARSGWSRGSGSVVNVERRNYLARFDRGNEGGLIDRRARLLIPDEAAHQNEMMSPVITE
jgi:hypothetical protein